MNAVIDPKEFDAAHLPLQRLLPLLTRIPTLTSSRSPLTMRASTTNPSRSTGAS